MTQENKMARRTYAFGLDIIVKLGSYLYKQNISYWE